MKQSIGISALNVQHRFDTAVHQLMYPQRPLTSSSNWLRRNPDDAASVLAAASGQNAIVAICSWSGYNQEDSIIMNKSSIDRGLFRSFVQKSTFDYSREHFRRPSEKCKLKKHAAYDLLDADGLVAPGTQLTGDVAIIGKTCTLAEGAIERDASNIWRATAADVASVSKVLVSSQQNTPSNVNYYDHNNYKGTYLHEGDFNMVKICTTSQRIPEIGDKFCKPFASLTHSPC